MKIITNTEGKKYLKLKNISLMNTNIIFIHINTYVFTLKKLFKLENIYFLISVAFHESNLLFYLNKIIYI